MKITDVKLSDPVYTNVKQSTDATVVNPAIRASSLVQISTDEGITGFASLGEPQVGPEGVSLNKLLIEHMFKPLVVRIPSIRADLGQAVLGQRTVGQKGCCSISNWRDRHRPVGPERKNSQSTGSQTARCPQGHSGGVREQRQPPRQ